MLFSGADMVRNTEQSRERFLRLAGGENPDSLLAVTAPNTNLETASDDSKNTLLRFAKFIKGEADQQRNASEEEARSKARKSLPKTLQKFIVPDDLRGQVIDIYA